MNPGTEWVVEFAARETRAREQSTRVRAEHTQGADLPRGKQWLRQQTLRSIHGCWLLVVGTLLSW